MIKMKSILSELLLNEALPISVARKYVSIERNPSIKKRLDDIFSKLASLDGASTSKRGDRVYFKFSSSSGIVTYESTVEKEIRAALTGTDYKLKDYKLGIAVDKHGRDVRLGKVLNKLNNQDLINKFKRDKTREASAKTEYILVFSKHPYDIAGMSTDRGWTSCMNLYKGAYKNVVSHDVQEGTFICYITSESDTNLNKPTGRVLFKPYVNTKDYREVVYVAEDRVYGTAPSNFQSTANRIIKKLQQDKSGDFQLVRSLYCDTGDKEIRYITKRTQQFLNGQLKPETKEDVQSVLNFMTIRGQVIINDDLTVDVLGDVILEPNTFSVIPIQFGTVRGKFECSYNGLESLVGSPEEVTGNFICSYNSLESLLGSPRKVGGRFECMMSRLESLEGGPEIVGGSFMCDYNKLRSLVGGPKKVGGQYSASNNKIESLTGIPSELSHYVDLSNNKLTSLAGSPVTAGTGFDVRGNELRTLEGAPRKVNVFDCSYNAKLMSLKGAPVSVQTFNAINTGITSLEGAPEEVTIDFSAGSKTLKSLNGAPRKIGRHFSIVNGNSILETLDGAPESVGGMFYMQYATDEQQYWIRANVKAASYNM